MSLACARNEKAKKKQCCPKPFTGPLINTAIKP